MKGCIRKTLTFAVLALFAGRILAVPPEKVWREVTMADGSKAKVMMIGDEWAHCLVTADGRAVDELDDGSYVYVDKDSVMAVVRQKKLRRSQVMRRGGSRRSSSAKGRGAAALESSDIADNYECFRGKRRGIVILAEFPDRAFLSEGSGPEAYYTRMLNEEGFGDDSNMGSVHDYFTDMSGGLFDLTFDVYGPVTLSRKSSYYGGSDGSELAGEFITESVELADATYDIDWTQYDWDGDGYVEEVFVLYAGYGQATGGGTKTLWPHMATLSDMKLVGNDIPGPLTFDGVKVDVYACANELYGGRGSRRMGIGVFCHEFSHCMGLPDMYDTGYSDNRGMGDWDLMDSGNYNGTTGTCPAPWTPWERHYAGWLEYTVLRENDSVKGLKPLLEEAKAYVIYNDGNPDEYYTLHNVGGSKWDSALPESGLLITHVDYDEYLFLNNIVNTTGRVTLLDRTVVYNDHERMAPFSRRFGFTYYETYPFKYGTLCVDSLTDYSNPRASVWNTNTDGSLLMHKPLYDIACDAKTGYVSFNYMPGATATAVRDAVVESGGGSMEIFDMTGKYVGDSGAGLPPGVYIRRDGHESKKIFVR